MSSIFFFTFYLIIHAHAICLSENTYAVMNTYRGMEDVLSLL